MQITDFRKSTNGSNLVCFSLRLKGYWLEGQFFMVGPTPFTLYLLAGVPFIAVSHWSRTSNFVPYFNLPLSCDIMMSDMVERKRSCWWKLFTCIALSRYLCFFSLFWSSIFARYCDEQCCQEERLICYRFLCLLLFPHRQEQCCILWLFYFLVTSRWTIGKVIWGKDCYNYFESINSWVPPLAPISWWVVWLMGPTFVPWSWSSTCTWQKEIQYLEFKLEVIIEIQTFV